MSRKRILYTSVEEALEDLTSNLLPFLRNAKMLADSGREPRPSPQVYANLCRALRLLEDRDNLKHCLQMATRDDGAVEVRGLPHPYQPPD
jgi:hypothetical protein